MASGCVITGGRVVFFNLIYFFMCVCDLPAGVQVCNCLLLIASF